MKGPHHQGQPDNESLIFSVQFKFLCAAIPKTEDTKIQSDKDKIFIDGIRMGLNIIGIHIFWIASETLSYSFFYVIQSHCLVVSHPRNFFSGDKVQS